jgi:hypothetical protein
LDPECSNNTLLFSIKATFLVPYIFSLFTCIQSIPHQLKILLGDIDGSKRWKTHVKRRVNMRNMNTALAFKPQENLSLCTPKHVRDDYFKTDLTQNNDIT